MSSYNLLDEKWIPIIAGNDKQEEVSLLQVFAHAQEYRRLAGDMETQNFALLRFLLAIIQTVFSRYDSEGNPIVEVDDVMRQTEAVDEDDLDDYEDEKEDTWDKLWEAKRFPGIVTQYLEKWRGHFYLYDDKFPFYQITEKEMEEVLPDKKRRHPWPERILIGLFQKAVIKQLYSLRLVMEREKIKRTACHPEN